MNVKMRNKIRRLIRESIKLKIGMLINEIKYELDGEIIDIDIMNSNIIINGNEYKLTSDTEYGEADVEVLAVNIVDGSVEIKAVGKVSLFSREVTQILPSHKVDEIKRNIDAKNTEFTIEPAKPDGSPITFYFVRNHETLASATPETTITASSTDVPEPQTDIIQTGSDAEASSPASPKPGPNDGRGAVSTRGIRIQVDSGNNNIETLEDLGYPQGTTRNVADVIMQAIRSANYTGTSQDGLKLKVKFSGRGVVLGGRSAVVGDRTQAALPLIQFNDLRFGIARLLRSSGRIPELVDGDNPTVTRNRRNYTLVITIPAGVKQQI